MASLTLYPASPQRRECTADDSRPLHGWTRPCPLICPLGGLSILPCFSRGPVLSWARPMRYTHAAAMQHGPLMTYVNYYLPSPYWKSWDIRHAGMARSPGRMTRPDHCGARRCRVGPGALGPAFISELSIEQVTSNAMVRVGNPHSQHKEEEGCATVPRRMIMISYKGDDA